MWRVSFITNVVWCLWFNHRRVSTNRSSHHYYVFHGGLSSNWVKILREACCAKMLLGSNSIKLDYSRCLDSVSHNDINISIWHCSYNPVEDWYAFMTGLPCVSSVLLCSLYYTRSFATRPSDCFLFFVQGAMVRPSSSSSMPFRYFIRT